MAEQPISSPSRRPITQTWLAAPLLVGVAAPRRLRSCRPASPPCRRSGAAAACLGVYLSFGADIAAGRVRPAPFWGTASLGIHGGLRLDGLSFAFVLLISGIGALIFLFTQGYFAGGRAPGPAVRGPAAVHDRDARRRDRGRRHRAVRVLGTDSLTSFLLVGFDHEKAKARKAALQALLITGGGGLALLAGLILVSMAAGTTSLSGILAAREAVLAHPAAMPAMLLIILGCFTKSAQVPFHFWLPNAMAAPTPVSAYLHSDHHGEARRLPDGAAQSALSGRWSCGATC